MKNTIKFIAIAILAGISFLNVSAQEQTIVTNTEGSATTAKAEKKVETANKKSSSNDDSWTGAYVGGYIGNTYNRAAANTSTAVVSTGYFDPTSIPAVNKVGAQKVSSNGLAVGGTFGYTKQVNHFAVGAEVDFGLQSLDKTATGTATYPCCAPTAFTINQTVKSKWLMTVRPRAGYANDKVFVYATGGLAVTKMDYSAKFTDTFASATESGSFGKTKAGWTAGAGIEVKVAKKWSVKGEYLFTQFGRESITSTNLGTPTGSRTQYPENAFTHSTDLKSHGIRFGFNYRF